MNRHLSKSRTSRFMTVFVFIIASFLLGSCICQGDTNRIEFLLHLNGAIMSETPVETKSDLVIGVCNLGEAESMSQVCRNEIWGFDEEKELLFLVKSSELYDFKAPVISPDGRFITYIRSAPIELGIDSPGLEMIQNKGITEIWLIELETKTERQLTDSRWSINMISDKVFQNWFYFTSQLEWSADGRFLYAVYHGQNPDGEFVAEHLIIDVLDRKTSQLFSSDYNSDAFFTWTDYGNDYIYFDSSRYYRGSVTNTLNEISKAEFDLLLPKVFAKCDSVIEAQLNETVLFGTPFNSISNRQLISDTKQIWKINPTTCELSLLLNRSDYHIETYIIESMDSK